MKLWVTVLALLLPLPASAGALQVLETPTSPLLISAPSQKAVIGITLENTSDAEVKSVTIEQPAFKADADEPIVAAIRNAPTMIGAHKTARFLIEATLPKIRTYSGLLRIEYIEKENNKDGARAINLLINITRIRSAPDLEVADSGAVSRVLGGAIDYNVYVRNNDTDPVTLVPPLIVSVTEKSKDDKAVTGVNGAALVFKTKDENGNILIPSNSGAVVSLVLSGIERPGKYDVSYRLRGTDGAELPAKTLTVYARQHWWIFFICVAIGLIASFVMRAYSTILRPRLLLERKVAAMLEDLADYSRLAGAGADAEAVALTQTLRGQIADTWNRLAIAGQLIGSTVFDTYEAKVAAAGQWLERWKSVRGIEPANVRAIFVQKLRAVKDELTTPGMTNVQAQADVLAKLPSDIDTELAKGLGILLQTLRSELQARNDPRFDPIVTELGIVQELLEDKKFKEVYARLAELRKRVLTVLADDLVAKLDPQKPAPGFDGTTWPPVVTRTSDFVRVALAESDPDAAAAAFAAAVSSYLRTVTAGVSAFVAKKIEDGSNAADQYKALQPEIIVVGDRIAAGKLDEAMALLDAVTKKIYGLGEKTSAGDAMSTADALAEQMPMLTGFGLLGFLGRGPDASVFGQRNYVRGIDRKLTGLDLVAAAIALVLTAITAYATLWAGDLTWGGWPAYAAAVLWGAGIHQLTWTGIGSLFTAFK